MCSSDLDLQAGLGHGQPRLAHCLAQRMARQQEVVQAGSQIVAQVVGEVALHADGRSERIQPKAGEPVVRSQQALIELAQNTVQQQFGVHLEREVRVVGGRA